MRRRSRAGGEPVKTRRRKMAARKRSNAPKIARHQGSSAAGPETEVVRLTRERDEALEQRTATAEVLKIISTSPTELQHVLEVVVRSAARFCKADDVTIFELDGQDIRSAAHWGSVPQEIGVRFPCTRGSVAGRVILERKPVHVIDLQAEAEEFPEGSAMARRLGHRTIAGVPLLREGVAVGTIQLRRAEVRPFTDKQIALLGIFADQAVIAIENVRLFEAEQQRTRELTELLEQQTATSEVLRIISSSPGELEPVFQVMLQNAARICEAKFTSLYLYDGDRFRVGALYNAPAAFAEFRRREPVFHPPPGSGLAQIVATKRTFQTPDMTLDKGYIDRNPIVVAAVELGGFRTVLTVPMLKDDNLIGCISIYRQEVRPFTDKQIDLVTNFAAQAVIAIENTRLLNELRELLQQQTATSEVLSVISSSPGELEPVFQAMLENATRLCDANFGVLQLCEEEGAFRVVAMHNAPPAYAEARRREPVIRPSSLAPPARVAASKQSLHIVDFTQEAAYRNREPSAVRFAEVAGVRTLIIVPMLKENELIGEISIYRQEVRAFTEKQIDLVQNFAAQAVIAIENARLLNELRQRTTDLSESLEQQTATSEVLGVISSSPGELEPVFKAMLENATRLCDAKFGLLWLAEGGGFRPVAMHNVPPALAGRRRDEVIHFGPETPIGRAIETRRLVLVADITSEPSYIKGFRPLRELADIGGARTLLIVPMLKENQVVGAFAIYRLEARLFAEKQIALVQNFAAQAVIAIENTRLLNELRQSLQQQTATADVLKIISRSTFDLKSVLNTLVESAARLCEADMASVPRVTGGLLDFFASYGYSPGFHEFLRNNPTSPGRGTVSGRAVLEGRTVHIPDVLVDPEYDYGEGQKIGGYRTLLGVPLMREGAAVGALLLGRAAPRPFTPQQIELLESFADQAVIAIENVRLFDEIQEKSRQLEEASQHKSQFLANMSHELRTPLNAILGYTELMADGAYGEPSDKMLGILKRLESNGKHLLGLINDVLDLSKIEAGQLVLVLSEYSVQDIAQTVHSTLEPLAADKKLAFKLELAPELPAGHGDGRRLTQVLINLVGNAIKFTDAGEVAIKAEASNGSFCVSVRDTGPGISADDQTRLFQEFQQADNAITKKKGGTGLGLAISKRIIEMHGGRIWVESQPGQGSTFTFTLPVIVERQVETA